MTEEQRLTAVTHWSALIDQWQKEKGTRDMAYEERPGRTNLFSNRHKKNPNQPDFRGKITLDEAAMRAVANGEALEIALWNKLDKNGIHYLSLSISEPYERPGPRQGASTERREEDIPF